MSEPLWTHVTIYSWFANATFGQAAAAPCGTEGSGSASLITDPEPDSRNPRMLYATEESAEWFHSEVKIRTIGRQRRLSYRSIQSRDYKLPTNTDSGTI